MAKLTRQQLYQYGQQAGFTGAALDEVVAIALAESGGDTAHINVNGPSVGKVNGQSVQVPAGTKDRGVLQINDWWNSGKPGLGPLVTDAQAFDPVYSFKWAYNVTGGRQPTATSDPFRPYWVTVQNGAYKKYLGSNPGGSSTTPTPTPTGGNQGGTTTTPTGGNQGTGTSGTGLNSNPTTGQLTNIPTAVYSMSNGPYGATQIQPGAYASQQSGQQGVAMPTNSGPSTVGGSSWIVLILVGIILVGGVVLLFTQKKGGKDDGMVESSNDSELQSER